MEPLERKIKANFSLESASSRRFQVPGRTPLSCFDFDKVKNALFVRNKINHNQKQFSPFTPFPDFAPSKEPVIILKICSINLNTYLHLKSVKV